MPINPMCLLTILYVKYYLQCGLNNRTSSGCVSLSMICIIYLLLKQQYILIKALKTMATPVFSLNKRSSRIKYNEYQKSYSFKKIHNKNNNLVLMRERKNQITLIYSSKGLLIQICYFKYVFNIYFNYIIALD